jgi:hypothetical protein
VIDFECVGASCARCQTFVCQRGVPQRAPRKPLTLLAAPSLRRSWSNAKALWVVQRPMNDEELLQQQVEMSTSASLGQTVWVYRGSMWAYPWYSSVRKTLEDPAYADWYIKFKPAGPWCVTCREQCALAAVALHLTLADRSVSRRYSDKCDRNYNPPLCSDYYHNQEQVSIGKDPGPPTYLGARCRTRVRSWWAAGSNSPPPPHTLTRRNNCELRAIFSITHAESWLPVGRRQLRGAELQLRRRAVRLLHVSVSNYLYLDSHT